MNDMMLIYSLFPNAGEAHDACRTLIDERLIASANRLSPVVSYHRWEGETGTSEEHPVIFKTSMERADAAMARLTELHRYTAPAIVGWQASKADPLFAAWVRDQVTA